MTLRRVTSIVFGLSSALLLLAFASASGNPKSSAAAGQPDDMNRRCVPVGGMLMTNFGAIDQNTTMGPATGDLSGAVSGSILGAPQPAAGNTVVFHVQHHWVTASGDTLFFDPATATTIPLSQSLFAIVTYPVHLTGGTGRFAGATGDINAIGEVDLSAGTVFRYSGQVCYAESSPH
jgi:hypothetical protein